ncbi:hypothetical protein CIW54_07485 [Paraburkholderia sp. T12-10]|nr:hypothetical protein CIW54_07485 [Paraburkholderia sp. T12-10]
MGSQRAERAANLIESQAASIAELQRELESTRQERNAAGVNARRELMPAHEARIAELEKERDALKADADRLDFVIDKQGIIVSQTGADGVRHYQLYQICEYGTGVILSGKILRFNTPRDAIDAALQAEKETGS